MQKIHKLLIKFNPLVPRSSLLVIAGLMWSGVGIMLCRLAYVWLTASPSLLMLLLAVLGVMLAVLMSIFIFSGMAHKNISRIRAYNKKACVFAFQAWKSYFMIIFMVTLGITLRSSPLPKPYLAVVYTTIGGALLLASFNYYASFFQELQVALGG